MQGEFRGPGVGDSQDEVTEEAGVFSPHFFFEQFTLSFQMSFLSPLHVHSLFPL